MKITSVRVRKLLSGPGYNHSAVEAEAAVEDGDDPSAVREKVSAWVDSELRGHREVDELREVRDQLRSTVRSLENQRDSLRKRIDLGLKIIREHEKLVSLARKEGIDVELDDLIPF